MGCVLECTRNTNPAINPKQKTALHKLTQSTQISRPRFKKVRPAISHVAPTVVRLCGIGNGIFYIFLIVCSSSSSSRSPESSRYMLAGSKTESRSGGSSRTICPDERGIVCFSVDPTSFPIQVSLVWYVVTGTRLARPRPTSRPWSR